jgi:hypothetical protein
MSRAENPKYDSTEWDELQKQFGNISETRRDKLHEDDEEEERSREDINAIRAEEVDKNRKQRCLAGELDDFLDDDDEQFMQSYRLSSIC